MLLNELLNKVTSIQVIGTPPHQEVTGIEYDSRKVADGSVFVAIKGYKTDGHLFVQDALNKKAIAVVLENSDAIPDSLVNHLKVIKIIVEDGRRALAELSKAFFDNPSKKLRLIGITGTNGKTTTSYFLKNIYETSGYKVGLIGTISNYIGKEKIESRLTTPESNDLNKMLNRIHTSGCDFAVMEVSSHSLVLKRVYGLDFTFAVFTNITAEHLDFHGDFQNYLNAKKILFDSLPVSSSALFNLDDLHSIDVIKDCPALKYSFGMNTNSQFRISNINCGLSGTSFTINYENKDYQLKTTLVGDFNAYNAAGAFAVAKLSGIKDDVIAKGISTTPQVPGRFEVLANGTRKIIIDYSHTPDSLEKTLMVIRKITDKKNPVFTVFGCGGNRDKLKRPLMGKIATELSDDVIVTSDNPRNENPSEIIEDIRAGITTDNYKVIEDREKAIEEAIKKSQKNSVILIAGKGHEDYQEIGNVRHHFSDKEIAKKYLGI
ncbi:MAG: UDP-N-acetylmuramoyl-L-alanyl-D-glutamate--2,6-diaminopimelate ligase [Ignavibacteriaceae bacterium]|jgi:UDP-N-acetylmuramoyl-L-alanyl-D-glutamate--2,6-diaminopimelate ligase|nr:UDP-N-acetylmuramoyl-L-alanyl-D-glutamate--2,6-diaminopimelate ligase [Ignavibacteriaceae bacterium]